MIIYVFEKEQSEESQTRDTKERKGKIKRKEKMEKGHRRNTKKATERATENYLNPQSVDCMCFSCLLSKNVRKDQYV